MLVGLDGADEVRRIDEGLVGSGVEPGEALSEQCHIQLAILEVDAVEVGDLELATCGWLQILRVLYDTVIIEVETRYTVVGLRVLRLLLDGDGLSVLVEGDDTETLRIIDIVAEDGRAGFLRCGLAECLLEAVAREDVVSEDHRDRIVTDEVCAQDEGLCESIRGWLYLIL